MPKIVCSVSHPRGGLVRISPAEAIGMIATMGRLYGWHQEDAVGSYRGQLEPSMIIDGNQLTLDSQHLDVLCDLLEACGQESLVFIDCRGFAKLIYMNGRPAEYLGRWSEVSLEEMEDAPPENWTQMSDGRCFTTN